VGRWDTTREFREGEPGIGFRTDLATRGIDGADDEKHAAGSDIFRGERLGDTV